MTDYMGSMSWASRWDDVSPLPRGVDAPTEEQIMEDGKWRASLAGDFLVIEAKAGVHDEKNAIWYKLVLQGHGEIADEYKQYAEAFYWVPLDEIEKGGSFGQKKGRFIADLAINSFNLLTPEETKGLSGEEVHEKLAGVFENLTGQVVTTALKWSAYVNKDGELKGPYMDLGRTSKSKVEPPF